MLINGAKEAEIHSADNLIQHYEKHGAEVGAKNISDYSRKAESYMDAILKKRIKPSKKIPGYTENVYRYYYNGKYIDLEQIQDGYKTVYKIVSFGKQ